MRAKTALALLALLLPVAWLAHGERATASGNNLDGRRAPDMSFREGLNGLGPNTPLSSFRGQVVLVKFWLRDCPVCRRELPAVQALYDRFGGTGLQVFTVVHQFPPSQVEPTMRELGYDFPVACDRDGSQAAKYGVGRRPVDYLIGIDGRVLASNGAPDALIQRELGRWRLAQVGTLPASMAGVRANVQSGRLGTALRLADAAAAAPDATAEVKAAAARVAALASTVLEGRAWTAGQYLKHRGRLAASGEYDGIVEAFRGTSLESRAVALQTAFRSRTPSRR